MVFGIKSQDMRKKFLTVIADLTLEKATRFVSHMSMHRNSSQQCQTLILACTQQPLRPSTTTWLFSEHEVKGFET